MATKLSYLGSKSIEEYIASVKHRAETLVKTVLPGRLDTLNDIINSPTLNVEISTLHREINIPIPPTKSVQALLGLESEIQEATKGNDSKKRKLELKEDENTKMLEKPKILKTEQGTRVHVSPCGPVDFNDKIVHLINMGKPIVRQLAQDANLLKMWITFLIPEMEAGNNFGVEIQEAILQEVQIIEAEAGKYEYWQILLYNVTDY